MGRTEGKEKGHTDRQGKPHRLQARKPELGREGGQGRGGEGRGGAEEGEGERKGRGQGRGKGRAGEGARRPDGCRATWDPRWRCGIPASQALSPMWPTAFIEHHLPTDRGFGSRPSSHFGGPSTPSDVESPGERGGFSGGVSGLSVLSPRREGLGSQRPGATYSWLYPGALPRDSRLQ